MSVATIHSSSLKTSFEHGDTEKLEQLELNKAGSHVNTTSNNEQIDPKEVIRQQKEKQYRNI